MLSKRIWIISEIYYPVKTSTAYYMTEIAEYLAAKEMDVHVLCTGAVYNSGEKQSCSQKELHNGVDVHRVYVPNINKNNFIKRTFRLLLSSLLLFVRMLGAVRKNDEILVVTNPAFLLLMMPFVAWIKGVSYKILVHDIFPENLVAIKKISSSSFVYCNLKKIFDVAYSKAQLCISIGRDMSGVLGKKVQDISRISFIPIWAENEEVFPVKKEDTKTCLDLGLQDKFIFQFAGNLGSAQGLDNLLEAIKLVENDNIHFLFIGDGAKSNEIVSYIKAGTHKNVSLLGFQDRANQNDFLNACDIGIVTLSDGMFGLGVPSKSYNIMAAGKPILYIGDRNSEIALCIGEYSLGWVVEPDNPKELAKMMEHIFFCKNSLSAIQNNTRMAADTIFAKKRILEEYYKLLN
jgi:glycosyltransferase involved in cell wall biosynthesis